MGESESVSCSGFSLCDPKDHSPPGSSIHGILQARMGCHFFLQELFPIQGLNLGILHCLKLNIQKTKIMASGPMTSWQIDGEKVETVSDFFGGVAPKSLQMLIAAVKLKDAYSLEGKL